MCRFIILYQVRRLISRLYISSPGHWICSFVCHFNPAESIHSPSHLGASNILRGKKHDNSLKIMHQAGFETARQATTLTKHHALTIAPCVFLNFTVNFATNHCVTTVLFHGGPAFICSHLDKNKAPWSTERDVDLPINHTYYTLT